MANKKRVAPAQLPASLVPEWEKLEEKANEQGEVTLENVTPEQETLYQALFGVGAVTVVSDTPAAAPATPRKVVIRVESDLPQDQPDASERSAARQQTFSK